MISVITADGIIGEDAAFSDVHTPLPPTAPAQSAPSGRKNASELHGQQHGRSTLPKSPSTSAKMSPTGMGASFVVKETSASKMRKAVSKANHLNSQYKSLAAGSKVCVCKLRLVDEGVGVFVFVFVFVFNLEVCGHKHDAVCALALTLTRTPSPYTQERSLWSGIRREMRRSASFNDINGDEDLKNDKNEEDVVRVGCCPISTITLPTHELCISLTIFSASPCVLLF